MSSSRCYPEKSPKVDELMDTLAHHLRREVIHFFENFATDDTASIDDITTHISGRVPSTEPSEVRAALHHAHLPKLDERGWLDYDARSGDIRYHGHQDAEQLLSEVADVFAT